MSVHGLLSAALLAAVRAHPPLAGTVSRSFDAPPVRSALPHLIIEEPVLIDWSTKDLAGREARVMVSVVDGGERPLRLRALADAIEGALAAMPAAIGDGWRVVTLLPVRSRIAPAGQARWRAHCEFRLRLLRSA